MDKKEVIERRILDTDQLDRMLAFWRFKDLSISLAYGTFDLLKPGTLNLLAQAAEKGPILLVAIKSDSIVKKHKGEGFPLYNHCDRAIAVASHLLVSGVHVVEVEDPAEFVEKVKPSAIFCCLRAADIELKAFQKIEEWGGEVFKVDTDKVPDRKLDSQCSCCE